MLDLRETEAVEVIIDGTGRVWVNVNGVCVLCVQKSRVVTVDDPVRGMDVIYEEKRDVE